MHVYRLLYVLLYIALPTFDVYSDQNRVDVLLLLSPVTQNRILLHSEGVRIICFSKTSLTWATFKYNSFANTNCYN